MPVGDLRHSVAMQRALTDQPQQIHSHRAQCAHQVVGVELARGQAHQIHVGLELRVELLVRAVSGVQIDDLLRAEGLGIGQGGAPALQHILRPQHLLASLVDGALGQAVDPPGRDYVLGVFKLNRIAPKALALALAQGAPERVRVSHPGFGNRLHRRLARVPLDDEGHSPLELLRLNVNRPHQPGRVKARVSAKQQGGTTSIGCARADARSQRQHALDVVFGLAGRVLGARAQSQLQAKALCAQVGRQRAEAIDPGVGAAHVLFGGAAVGNSESIHVQRQLAAGQQTEVDGFAGVVHAQHGGIDALGQLEPVAGVGIEALAQGKRGRHGAQVQRAGEEGVGALGLNGVKVVLAQAQQAQIALQDVAVGDTRAHRESGINKGVEVDALEVFADECQARLAAQVVRSIV